MSETSAHASYMATHGPALLARGYDLTSIIDGLKHPGRGGWQNDRVGLRHDAAREALGDDPSAVQVHRWAADRRITGAGVMCNTVHAIDIDVLDPLMADAVARIVEQRLGVSTRRIGKAPKVLLPYRCAAPLRRSRSTRYRNPVAPMFDDAGKELFHGLDFWGDGSQFVAYGWHPDTGQPYRYEGPELADLDLAALPLIAEADIEYIATEFDRVCRRAGWAPVSPADERGLQVVADATQPGGALASAAPKFGADLDDVRRMLEQIDPDLDGNDYDTVIKAVAFEFDGAEAAFEVVREWASRGAKWSDKGSGLKQLRTRWARACRPPAGVAPVRLATLQDWITRGRNPMPGALEVADPFALPDDDPLSGFGAVEGPAAKPKRFFIEPEHVFAADFAPPDWLVTDYLVTGEASVLFGDPGTYKSFVALDIAYHVAAGRKWHGHAVKQCAVVYVAGEGRHGLRARSAAWRKHHDLAGAVPLGFTSGAINLSDAKALAPVVAELDAYVALFGRIGLLVVDTLARNNTGDENSNTEMSIVMQHAAAIQARYGCAVLIIHHSGTTNKDRARGASAIHGAVDSQYRMDRIEDRLVKMVCVKMKDAPEPRDKWFAGDVVQSGDASSLVFTETEARSGEVNGNPTSPAFGLSGLQKAVYDLIAAEQPVERDTLRRIVHDEPASNGWNVDPYKRGSQLRQALRSLQERDAVRVTGADTWTTYEYGEALDGFEKGA